MQTALSSEVVQLKLGLLPQLPSLGQYVQVNKEIEGEQLAELSQTPQEEGKVPRETTGVMTMQTQNMMPMVKAFQKKSLVALCT